MWHYKYGDFADMQISEIKEILRKRIFFLLVVADDEYNNNKQEFPEINLVRANTSVLWRVSGLNSLLGEPTELVTVVSLLEEAKNTITDSFDFEKYRKLILDAGAEIMKITSSEDEQQEV